MFSNIWDGRVPEGDKDESRWGEINREGDVHHSGIHRERVMFTIQGSTERG